MERITNLLVKRFGGEAREGPVREAPSSSPFVQPPLLQPFLPPLPVQNSVLVGSGENLGVGRGGGSAKLFTEAKTVGRILSRRESSVI